MNKTIRIVLWILAISLAIFLAPIVLLAGIAVLITAIVAVSAGSRTWLRFRTPAAAKTALWMSGATTAVAALVVGVLIAGAASTPQAATNEAAITDAASTPASSAPVETVTPSPTTTPTPVSTPTPARTAAPAAGSALAMLETLPIKGRAPKTGYSRTQFGPAWADVDGNSCDTRDDILARDLTSIVRDGSCKVTSGTLVDPYTRTTIHFKRGVGTSTAVQIDHVVALSDAWQKGAQKLTASRREQLANDPLNLLAVDGPTNEAKGDGDAATWLPPNKGYRCAYVARQVAVKSAYHLWVTQAEHDAIARVLAVCPNQKVPTATSLPEDFTPKVITTAPKAAPKSTAPKPVAPKPAAPRVVHPGAYCSPAGATGVTSAGTPMVCGPTANSARNRWHRG